MSNAKNRTIRITSILACKYFKQGMADYHAGRWSDVVGAWYRFDASEMYEKGRLVACVTGVRKASVADYMKAKSFGAFC